MIRIPLVLALALAMPMAGLALPLEVRAQTSLPMVPMTIPADPAQRQISVVVNKGLTHTKKLPTEELRIARKSMFEGKDISDADLRALADHGDGLAAQKYVRRLIAQGLTGNASDIAYYGSIAVSTGRVWSLPDAVEAMHLLDPKTEPESRKKVYAAMLYPHAWAGNALALDAIIDLNGEGRLFGPLSEATRQRILEQGEKNGDGRAALRLAVALAQKTERTPKEDTMLMDYLQRASAAQNMVVKTTAANMMALLEAPSAKVASDQ